MFVKLQFRDGRESIYQCDRFFSIPVPVSAIHYIPGSVDVSLESNHPNGSVHLGQLDRSRMSIFVMNDAGKTIETYHAVPAADAPQAISSAQPR